MLSSEARFEKIPIDTNSRLTQDDSSLGVEKTGSGLDAVDRANGKFAGSKRGLGSLFIAIPQDEFLERLRIEKRRAERANSALSIMLMSFDKKGNHYNDSMPEVLKFLSKHLRETDIIGFANRGKIGVLLPNTDERGMQCIVQKFHRGLEAFHVYIAGGTYPNQLFESVAGSIPDQPNVVPLVWEHPNVRLSHKLAIKRIVDVIGAITGMLAFSPVMLLTAIAVKMTSPGPIIFRQTRLGKNGVPFVFHKFRSMRIDSDDAIHREYVRSLIAGNHDEINQGEEEKPLYKMASDPRVTKIGRFIRKTSIDELPQFFNVLKGEMSLVGPRPPLPYEIEAYDAWHLRRILDMKPGITGLWQVEGRSKTTFDEAVRLDVRYIENWSLWLDFSLLIRTVKAVLKCDGAV